MFIVGIFFDQENICIDTDFMALPLLVLKILAKIWFFSNGGTNLHFQNDQKCQEGIIQFLNLGYIKIRKLQ